MDNFDDILKQNGFEPSLSAEADKEKNKETNKEKNKSKIDASLYDLLDSDKSEHVATFIVKLINQYIRYFNNTRNIKSASLFDNIDPNDDTSTNRQLEDFYDAKQKFELLPKKIPNYTTLYEPQKLDASTCEELYGIFKKRSLIIVSQSLFAVLIEITNLISENPDLEEDFVIKPLQR
jgi:hypothetical protein